jgi:hypothetical protein
MGRKHITITPQQCRQLNECGAMHGRGMMPDAFDPDDWGDMTSMIDIPVYVAKGRGQYEGEGGRWTTLLSEMFKKASKNPEVRKLAKAAAGKAVKKGSAAARKRAGDSGLAGMAIDLAEGKASEALDKHLGSGKRMRYGGQGTQGVRLSGSGLRAAHAGSGHCGGGHEGMGLRIA